MDVLTEQHCPQTELLTNNQAKKRLYYVTTCAYCGLNGTFTHGPDGNFWHIDHVYPTSKGGQNVAANLVKSCAPCNISKADQTGPDWQPRRGTLTAALKPWDWRHTVKRSLLIETYVADLEHALEEHRAALESLRQRIQIAALIDKGEIPKW